MVARTELVTVDPEFEVLLVPLAPEERAQLEENLLRDGCLDPLKVWETDDGAVLLDGHHRLAICREHDLPYSVEPLSFPDRNAAKTWMIRNQFGRRNLTPYQRCELALELEAIVAEEAKDRQRCGQGGVLLSPNSDEAKGRTDERLAKLAGVGKNTIRKAKFIKENAPDELKDELRRAEVSIHAGYAKVVQSLERQRKVAELESIASQEVKAIAGVYDVIVIDPPWPMKKVERQDRPMQVGNGLDYPTMSEDELREYGPKIPSADDCHVFLWTTQRFRTLAEELLGVWGFQYTCEFVWKKPGGFQILGFPQYNHEIVLWGRKGKPIFIDTRDFKTCFSAPRGKHSEKPEEFYDTVRRVTGGRRLDMFARRTIEGFDAWGKEAK